jgi:hypothetical protein
MQVAEQVGTLEEVTAKLAERRATVAGLQREIEEATQEAAGLKNLREKFLVMDGEAATRHVQEIEGQQQTVGRKLEGLRLRLLPWERALHETEVDHAALAQKAAAAERARQDEQLIAEVEKDLWNINASFRALCRRKFNLDERVRQLDERQKLLVLPMVLEGLRPPVTWNEHWEPSSYKLGTPLTVLDACAPDELRHLEELK